MSKFTRLLWTYLHSLLGIAIAMAVIFFTLNFLHTKGPSFLQGPADTAGKVVSGQQYNF